jgi:hypothetical protein
MPDQCTSSSWWMSTPQLPGDGGISHDTYGSVAEHEHCATTKLEGAIHGDVNNEPSNDVDRLITKPIDWNRSYLLPIAMNL